MNKWVGYRILKTVVVTVVPELAYVEEMKGGQKGEGEGTVKELLEQRGIVG